MLYLEHYGLREPPFRITPHTDFFFEGANRGSVLDALVYAVSHDEGIIKLVGEVGSGKTMLCRMLIDRLPRNVDTIYLAIPSLSRDEILHAIAAELKFNIGRESPSVLVRALQDRLITSYAEGRRVVVLIDEAHAMPLETLEQIRLLSNLESSSAKLLQIVLFGQPELDDNLAEPRMRQLKERITQSFQLPPMVQSDIESYLMHRMRAAGYRGPDIFTKGAVRLIAAASVGLSRRVNILADKALMSAYADNVHAIKPRHVRAAIKDTDFARPLHRPVGIWVAAAAAGGIALGFALAQMVHQAGWRGRDVVAAPVAARPPATAELGASAAPKAEPNPVQAVTGAAKSAADAMAVAPSPVEPAVLVKPAAPLAASQNQSSPPNTHADPARLARLNSAGIVTEPFPGAGALTKERMQAGTNWLALRDASHHTVQLMRAEPGRARALEEFLARLHEHIGLDQVYVYGVQSGGNRIVNVVYGDFPNQAAAIAALSRLPGTLRTYQPFPRSLATIVGSGTS